MRLDISDNCCATARQLIAEGLDPVEVLEFCRGDMVCLRGKASDFAKLRVREDEWRGPEFVRYEPMTPEAKARLSDRGRRPRRLRPSNAPAQSLSAPPHLMGPAGLRGMPRPSVGLLGPTGPAA